MSTDETTNGRTITTATQQKVTAAPDHGGIHLTVAGHGRLGDAVLNPAEAREVAQLLLALADSVDASKGA